jgi:alpha-D-xyloside xylohydrolase
MRIFHLAFALFVSATTMLAQVPITWKESYPGIWKADVGKPQKHSLLKAAGGKVNLTALQSLPKTQFPLD